MSITVFYSWQSDLHDRESRTLIRDALAIAIRTVNADLELEESIALDQDTHGVPGSPDIAATILSKIAHCGIFVGDMSLAFSTVSGKRSPNPNVLLEYGYALSVLGSERLVTVMNTAYGSQQELPFDLSKRRWPLSYNLPEGADTTALRVARDQLAKGLTSAIRAIVAHIVQQTDRTPHSQWRHEPVHSCTSFLSDKEVVDTYTGLDHESQPEPRYWINGPQAAVIVRPHAPRSFSRRELDDAVRHFAPMGRGQISYFHGRNKYGANAYGLVTDSTPMFLTQLFPTGEIWGMDRFVLRSGIIQLDYLREVLEWTIRAYLRIGPRILDLSPPMQVTVCISGINAFQVAASRSGPAGSCVDDCLKSAAEIGSLPADPKLLIDPLFDLIMENAGLHR